MSARGRRKVDAPRTDVAPVDRLAAILSALGGRWPVVTGPGWALIHGDCLDVMAAMPDKSVAHAFEDPPYDAHTHSATRRGHTGYTEGESSKRATFSRSTSLGFDAITAEQMAETGKQIGRVVRGWSGTFCSVEMVSDWRRCFDEAGHEYVRTMAWRKIGSTPQFSGDRPAAAFEAIVLTHPKGRKRWNGGGRHGWYDITDDDRVVYEHPIVLHRGDGVVRAHTTQKPTALLVEMIADFTQAGDLVIDPYMGSATTGIACIRLGRQFLGIERDPAYFEIACRRMRGDEAKPRPEQPSLFSLMTPEAP